MRIQGQAILNFRHASRLGKQQKWCSFGSPVRWRIVPALA